LEINFELVIIFKVSITKQEKTMRSIEDVEEAIRTCDRIINNLKTKEDEEEVKREDDIRLRFITRRNVLKWVFDEKKDDWI
jgi:hypothetical protein